MKKCLISIFIMSSCILPNVHSVGETKGVGSNIELGGIQRVAAQNNMHHFTPLPDVVVKSTCKWEVNLTTVYNRIPTTITEILCLNRNTNCGNFSNYFCRQMRIRMVVGYVEKANEYTDDWYVINQRNQTIGVGCSCVLRRSTPYGILLGSAPLEKKRSL